MRVDLIGTI